MRSPFAFILGMTFLALPGCLYHGGYYPNGYYAPGPSVLPSQPWTGYPGGPGYQPGGPVYQPAVPMNQPGGTYPTPLGNPYVPGNSPGAGNTSPYTPTDTNNPTYAPNGGTNNAPGFDQTPGSTGGTGVPKPNDDDGGFNRGTQRPNITPTSGARTSDDRSPFGEENSSRRQRNFADPQVAEADSPFESPVVQASTTSGSDVRFANQQTEASSASTKRFANHPRFEWVQGVVEYDDASKTWVIMYNDNPRTSDLYGGELTLADDQSLARLRSGDAVRIYGSLDASERDPRGKPVYRMTRVESRER